MPCNVLRTDTMTHSRSVYIKLLPLLLVPLGIFIYAGALGAPFVYDDKGYILQNETIRSLANFTDLSGTRYLAFLSFALNYAAGGLDPFGYHLVNVLIHTANAVLVFFLITTAAETPLLRRFVSSRELPRDVIPAAAFVTALIFLAHPVQTQAVTYVTQRFASLATMFYLAAVVFYSRARVYFSGEPGEGRVRRWLFYSIALLSTLMAMKTKEISFTLPFVIALYDYLFFQAGPAGGPWARRTLLRVPFYLTLVVIPLSLLGPELGIGGVGGGDTAEVLRAKQLSEAGELSRYLYTLTQFRVIVTYMRLLVYPAGQSIDYYYPLSGSLLEPATAASAAFIVAFISFALYAALRSIRNRSPLGVLFSFGVFWFFITLSVESFVVPIQDVIFEQRVYLPSVGFITAAVVAVFYMACELGRRGVAALRPATVAVVLAALLLPPLAYGVGQRNRLWNDEVLLLDDAIAKSPVKHRLYYARSAALFDRGELDRALSDAERALEINPDSPDAYNMRGIVRAATGAYAEAIEDLTRAVELSPDDKMAFHNRGLSYAAIGDYASALSDYTTAISLDPAFALAYNDRGVAYARLGMVEAATKDIRISCDLGNTTACENLATLTASAAAR